MSVLVASGDGQEQRECGWFYWFWISIQECGWCNLPLGTRLKCLVSSVSCVSLDWWLSIRGFSCFSVEASLYWLSLWLSMWLTRERHQLLPVVYIVTLNLVVCLYSPCVLVACALLWVIVLIIDTTNKVFSLSLSAIPWSFINELMILYYSHVHIYNHIFSECGWTDTCESTYRDNWGNLMCDSQEEPLADAKWGA